jgi:hypothetical protein
MFLNNFINTLFYKNNMEIIEVDLYNYKKAEAPDILTSGGLGPCIAVGAICGNQGFLAHYLSYGTIPLDLDLLLADLQSVNKSQLEIYVAGAGLDGAASRESDEGVLEGRKLCLDRIAQAGFTENIKKIQWNPGNHIQELTLDLATGNALYEEDPLSDFPDLY